MKRKIILWVGTFVMLMLVFAVYYLVTATESIEQREEVASNGGGSFEIPGLRRDRQVARTLPGGQVADETGGDLRHGGCAR